MSLGCEAFAVSVDDPAEVYGDLRGDRVPFGFDLEWETDGGVYPWIGSTRYEVPCTVHGEILVGDETIDFDGIGQRDHSWGVRDWWSVGWMWTAGGLADGTRFHTTRVRIPGLEAFAPGYVQAARRPAASRSRRAPPRRSWATHGFPAAAHLTLRRARPPGRAGGLQPRPPRGRRRHRPAPRPVPAGAVPLRVQRRPHRRGLDGVEPAEPSADRSTRSICRTTIAGIATGTWSRRTAAQPGAGRRRRGPHGPGRGRPRWTPAGSDGALTTRRRGSASSPVPAALGRPPCAPTCGQGLRIAARAARAATAARSPVGQHARRHRRSAVHGLEVDADGSGRPGRDHDPAGVGQADGRPGAPSTRTCGSPVRAAALARSAGPTSTSPTAHPEVSATRCRSQTWAVRNVLRSAGSAQRPRRARSAALSRSTSAPRRGPPSALTSARVVHPPDRSQARSDPPSVPR